MQLNLSITADFFFVSNLFLIFPLFLKSHLETPASGYGLWIVAQQCFYYEISDRIFSIVYIASRSSSPTLHRSLEPKMKPLWRSVRVFLLGLSLASLSLCGASRFHIPPHDQVARVARFVAHQVDWASMATISTHKPVVGQPFSNVFSVSDGPRGSGSGVPYMYLTRMEISVQDLEVSLTRDISVKTGTEPSRSEVIYKL